MNPNPNWSYRRHAVNLLICLAALAFVSFEGSKLLLFMRDPIVLLSVQPEKTVLKLDEPLTLHIRYRRTRICRVLVDRFIVNLDNGELVTREATVGSPGQETGEIYVVNVIQMPSLPPGRYMFYNNGYPMCFEGQHTYSWEMPFTVIQ